MPQPGDGDCLFHSLAHFLPGETPATLRGRVARCICDTPDEIVAGSPLRDWVEWDSGLDPSAYASRVVGAHHWGGAIEMAVLAHLLNMAIHVYERETAGGQGTFRQIARFGGESDLACVAHVVYEGRSHYDALRVTDSSVRRHAPGAGRPRM